MRMPSRHSAERALTELRSEVLNGGGHSLRLKSQFEVNRREDAIAQSSDRSCSAVEPVDAVRVNPLGIAGAFAIPGICTSVPRFRLARPLRKQELHPIGSKSAIV
jgi:hypothetical protein